MKKRLRKKLRLGEFREFGFDVKFRLQPGLDDDAIWRLSDAFLEQAIEGNGLVCGGGCGRAWDVFVTRAGRGTATEQHRTAVTAWLQQHHWVSDIEVGPLIDAWHST